MANPFVARAQGFGLQPRHRGEQSICALAHEEWQGALDLPPPPKPQQQQQQARSQREVALPPAPQTRTANQTPSVQQQQRANKETDAPPPPPSECARPPSPPAPVAFKPALSVSTLFEEDDIPPPPPPMTLSPPPPPPPSESAVVPFKYVAHSHAPTPLTPSSARAHGRARVRPPSMTFTTPILLSPKADKEKAPQLPSPDAAAAAAAVCPDSLDDCPPCHQCHRIVYGPVLELGDGRSFHPSCFLCAGCNLALVDDVMTVGDRAFHGKCLRCAACQTNLAQLPFATHPTTGALFCTDHARMAVGAKKDAPAPPVLAATAPPSSTPSTAPASSGPSLVRCSGCHATVDPTDASDALLVSHGGTAFFHARCMRCHTCKCSLGSQDAAYTHDGHFYCARDWALSFGQQCATCSRTITEGRMLQVDAGTDQQPRLAFHSACFTCAQCKCPLEGASFTRNPRGGGILCVKCIMA